MDEAWAFLVLAPFLFAVTLPALSRQADRENDPGLFRFLLFALFLKLIVGTLVRYYVTFYVYTSSDATGYVGRGTDIAQQMAGGTYEFKFGDLRGSQTISFLTGILFRWTGATRLGGFLVFSWLAFVGMFLLYRAFVIAVPEGQARTYAKFLFLLPTMWYWPSSIGKEAWMIFTLGIAAFGAARALKGRAVSGAAIAGLGLWLMLFVRPHIAGMFGAAFVAAFVVKRSKATESSYAVVGRLVGLVLVGVLAVFMIGRAAEFLGLPDLSLSSVTNELESISTRSDTGGSAFDPVVVTSPLQVPLAFVTVLFRPFVTEANNSQAVAAALESAFLLLLTIKRLPWVWSAIKSMRRQAYVGLALVFTVVFVIAFASFPNFGLLVRQRTQLLPFYLVLLVIPPARPTKEESEPTAEPVAASRA